jgi:molybdopterin-guanine dinucleotide biosynthesis protein
MRAANGTGAALAEARFHVANAAVLDAVMSDPTRARRELQHATAILSDNRPLVMDRLAPTLETIRREIDGAAGDVAATTAADWARYERIEIELDHLINTIRRSGMCTARPEPDNDRIAN